MSSRKCYNVTFPTNNYCLSSIFTSLFSLAPLKQKKKSVNFPRMTRVLLFFSIAHPQRRGVRCRQVRCPRLNCTPQITPEDSCCPRCDWTKPIYWSNIPTPDPNAPSPLEGIPIHHHQLPPDPREAMLP